MLNGKTPVLVSWAVPKNLPREKSKRTLAIHVEDHPIDYGQFSGTIPEGNYGAGEVRIFDAGLYEMLEQAPNKISFRLKGKRLKGVWNLIKTGKGDKDEWLALLKQSETNEPEPLPAPQPMLGTPYDRPFDDDEWSFEPMWEGLRVIAVCDAQTHLFSEAVDLVETFPTLNKIHERLVAIDGMIDGHIVTSDKGAKSASFIASDLIYLDGKSLLAEPLLKRRKLLEQCLVTSEIVELSPVIEGRGKLLYETARAQGMKGIVAKKLTSRYAVGHHSEDWREISEP